MNTPSERRPSGSQPRLRQGGLPPWLWWVLPLVFVIVAGIVFVVIALVRSSPNSGAAAWTDGYNDAAGVTTASQPSPAEMRSACSAYFHNDLTGNELGDPEGSFVQGCVHGIRDKLAHG